MVVSKLVSEVYADISRSVTSTLARAGFFSKTSLLSKGEYAYIVPRGSIAKETQ